MWNHCLDSSAEFNLEDILIPKLIISHAAAKKPKNLRFVCDT